MAEEALKKIEEGLNCSICLDTYTDPKLLQCFHVYCRQCLVPLVDRNQRGKLGLTCPICRQVTPIPDRGVTGLQPAFHINHLLEIQDSVRKLDNPEAALEGAVGGATIAEPTGDPAKHCFEHPAEEVKLYCETCGELVCYECGLAEGKHQSHRYKKLDQAFQEYKEEITSFIEPMEKQVATATKALVQLDTRCGEISDQRAATKDNIHVTFRRLRDTLDVRETELIGQLDQITQGKLKDLAVQKDQIEITLAQLNSCLHFMRESLRTDNQADTLMMKRNTVQQVKELTTPFPQDSLEPNTEADVEFSTLADLMNMCRNYGQIVVPSSPDPSKCYTTGSGAEAAAVGEESTFILHAFDFKGKPCKGQIESLECGLLSEITGTRASVRAERKGQNQYALSYQPTIKGRHQLHIKVSSQHIKGSPFSVTVKSSVDTLGTPILTIRGVKRPLGVAVTERGEVVVTEDDSHSVSVFSPSGMKLRSFGTRGSGQGQFNSPHGISLDGEGNILVADSSNHRIQRFTAEGQFLTAVGTKGSRSLHFSIPRDIAFNASNHKIYVVEEGNSRVQVLNADLTFFSTFGKRGNGKGQFEEPCGIACDSTGKVYVADWVNKSVQVFTAEGKFLRILDREGKCIGVSIGPSDMVYISYPQKDINHVSVVTSEGRLVKSFGSELTFSVGLAVDASGVVYVCDAYKGCVEVF